MNEDSKRLKSFDLFVSKEHYHHHAYEIVRTHDFVSQGFRNKLTSRIDVEVIERFATVKGEAQYRLGISAHALNSQIRKVLDGDSMIPLVFEVSEQKGVFYFSNKSSIGGFDFAILNHEKNLIRLRNICFGEISYQDGESRWHRFLYSNPKLRSLAEEIERREYIGKDIEQSLDNIKEPLIVGEIQFGNWALAYRDFFKVLKANVHNNIDCLIYIVPTGELEALLSSNIVTFDKTVEIIKEFEKVISVPIWIIGLDVKE